MDETPRDSFEGTERFERVRRIGAGGMGVVYQVRDRDRDVHLALKTLRKLTPASLLRFKAEFRTLAELAHPNLVRLGELVATGDEWFFTMELVEGDSIIDHVRPRAVAGGAFVGPTLAGPPLPVESTGALTLSDGPTRTGAHGRQVAPSSLRGPLDEASLRQTFVQLAHALHAIHSAGKVHRDVKPSNVLVAPDGRVVVLDLGVVAEIGETEPLEQADLHVVGTPTYMAPEQADGGAVGPEADWYAVGVMLYEALTGAPPFAGTMRELLEHKRTALPPPPRDRDPSAPADLVELCLDLLDVAPGNRPGHAEVVARLRGPSDDRAPGFGAAELDPVPFVGRGAELGRLAAALDRARAGEAAVVLVTGESGIGKSALLRRFEQAARAQAGGLTWLGGRCYELESVPFKAVDRVIDELGRALLRLPPDAVAELLPPDIGLLAQTFPVLLAIEAIAESERRVRAGREPHEQRRRGFAALRELVVRLCARGPLVLAIDDLQWADGDSLALLGELLREPAPPLLLVASLRVDGAVPRALAAALGPRRTELELGGLAPTVALELAEHLLARRGHRRGADHIAAAAAGHPLFIDELVRHRGGPDDPRLGFDDALWQRIDALDPSGRAVVELCALAGRPVGAAALAAAAALEPRALAGTVEALREANLVRVSGLRASDTIEVFHDRVRAAVVARLAPTVRAHQSRRLALALERGGRRDAEALSRLWREAGEPILATRYALAAAQRAQQALALDQAVRAYRFALELGACDRRAVLIELAGALADAGRGTESAEAYLAAAALPLASPDDDDATALGRRAAEQYLRSGRVDQGIAELRRVLGALAVPWPAAPREVLTSFLLQRARLRLRGLRPAGRAIAPHLLRRDDACFAAGHGLAMIDPVRAADFQTRSLLQALAGGPSERLARSLAVEAGFIAMTGGRARRRAARVLDAARRTAAASGSDYAGVFADGVGGIVGFLGGEWRQARDRCDAADLALRDRFRGVTWERAMMQLYGLWARFFLGELAELRRRVPERLREAEARGDLFLATNLQTGVLNLVSLVDEDVAGIERNLDAAMGRWSQTGYHVQHFLGLYARGHLALANDRGAAALALVEATWPTLRQSRLLLVEFVRVMMLELRAQAALAAARSASHPGPLLFRAERDAWRMRLDRRPWSTALAELVLAGVAERRGRPAQALARLRRAASGFADADMALHAALARRELGRRLGDREGRELARDAGAWLAAEGVVNPERLARAFATL